MNPEPRATSRSSLISAGQTMTVESDCLLEARVALELAAEARSDADRLKWVRVAVAWQDLARHHEGNGPTRHNDYFVADRS